jgi:hypothetical protein
VFYRDLVERAVDTALEKRKSILNGVRVPVAYAVAPGVIDRQMFRIEIPLEVHAGLMLALSAVPIISIFASATGTKRKRPPRSIMPKTTSLRSFLT